MICRWRCREFSVAGEFGGFRGFPLMIAARGGGRGFVPERVRSYLMARS
jgi:hypothetical protein